MVKIETRSENPPDSQVFSETGSSFNSAVYWLITLKFGTHRLSTNELRHQTWNRKLICDAVADILKNTYDIITPPAVLQFG